MTKHTPGPWTAGRLHPDGTIAIGSGSQFIAKCAPSMGSRSSVDEFSANARLIAASPDLLSALDLLVTHADPDTHDGEYSHVEMADLYHAIADARAAIARARGKS